MAAPPAFAVVEDPRYREHAVPPGHPERPERLIAVGEALRAFEPQLVRRPPRPAQPDEILRVHADAHLRQLEDLSGRPVQLDPDTYMGPASYEIARLAAGAAIDLVQAVARGEVRSGLAAVRPPGHHAEAGRAMGFCLFNNVAVAARAVQASESVERILILDWDVHHGNGTQHSFESDPNVLYVSTHQYPYYPGTGGAGEQGVDAGVGATVNIPMPAGCGDEEYLGAFFRLLAPAARAFRPELILVSCGFDAHESDPLASMGLTGAGFAGLTAIVRSLADELCAGRVAFVLEGGYAAEGLDQGTRAVVGGMLAHESPLPPVPDMPAGHMLRGIIDRVTAVHGGRIPDLGAG
ncbi:MAG: histone deacetylase family protein [Myxococcota bacterium]